MRKNVILIVTILLIIILAFFSIKGMNIGSATILSYKQIGESSKDLKIYINNYESKNNNDLKAKEQELIKKIEEYQNEKQEYNDILEQKQTELSKVDIANISDIDFLLVRIGNYATEHSLNLIFNVTKNSSDKNATEYILTDLNFEVTGEYYQIADYINELETDSRLEFEIRDFKMVDEVTNKTNTSNKTNTLDASENTTSKVTATFKVYEIAVNRNTITELNTVNSNSNVNNNTNNTANNNSTNNSTNEVE